MLSLLLAITLALLEKMANPINVHTASAVDLAKIKGIGDKKAARIIEARGEDGQDLTMEKLVLATGLSQLEWATKVHHGEIIANFPPESLRMEPRPVTISEAEYQDMQSNIVKLQQELQSFEKAKQKLEAELDSARVAKSRLTDEGDQAQFALAQTQQAGMPGMMPPMMPPGMMPQMFGQEFFHQMMTAMKAELKAEFKPSKPRRRRSSHHTGSSRHSRASSSQFGDSSSSGHLPTGSDLSDDAQQPTQASETDKVSYAGISASAADSRPADASTAPGVEPHGLTSPSQVVTQQKRHHTADSDEKLSPLLSTIDKYAKSNPAPGFKPTAVKSGVKQESHDGPSSWMQGR